jgi:CRP-like cAMP-binding protein
MKVDFDPIIKNVANVIPLDEREISFFTSLLEPRSFRKKEVVLRSGDVCQYELFVVNGCLKIFYIDNEGIDHIMKFAIENWWSLDLKSFMTQTPAFYTIQATEDTQVFRLSKPNHDLLHEQVSKFEKFSRIMFQNSYILLQHRMTQNLFSTAEEKYEHFREKYPGLELRVSQKDVASYLGITPEFLSMIRKKSMERSIS